MTNKEAIETLLNHTQYKCNGKDLMAIELAIKALEELPKRRKEAKRWKARAAQIATKPNGWIPVSERLPEAGEYVGDVAKYHLAQNEYGDMLVARYTHSGYWEQIYQLKPIGDEIVAWMPLPEPYKVEQQESDHKCHTCKHYTNGEHDGSCGSYICRGYSNWESEEQDADSN